MTSKFKGKDLRIVAIDPSGAVRQLLSEVLRNLGFENAQAVGSLKDTIGLMEVEPVDWVITPLASDEDVNALQLLEMILSHEEIHHVRVSLLIEEDEMEVLPCAFSQGLLNWFIKPFNKDSIKQAFNEFLTRIEQNDFNEVKTAFQSFNDYMAWKGLHDMRISLANEVLDLYAGDANAIEVLIDAYDKTGNAEKAKSAYRQLKVIAPDRVGAHHDFAKRNFTGDEEEEGASVGNLLDLGEVVIVDPEEKFRTELKTALGKLGVTEVSDFDDGEKAWEHINGLENPPSLILMEWRIPGLTGPALLQRVRNKHATTPVIIESNLLGAQDKPLLHEMGVARLIEKPYDEKTIVGEIVNTVQQERHPSDPSTLERKIRLALRGDKMDEAKSLAEKYYADSTTPSKRKTKIKAEFAYKEEKYEEAKEMATEAIKSTSDSIMLLNLLGKILLKLGEPDASLRCLEKAQEMSPMNLARLCQIAEVQSEIGEEGEARDSIDQASEQDGESQQVQASSAKVEMNLGNIEAAKSIMSEMDSLSEVVSYMNNKAVALAQTGEIEKSVSMYGKTFESIPDNKEEIKAIVKYNLGLAMIRQHEYPEALKAMKEAVDIGESRVLARAKALKVKLQKAIESGIELKLQTSSAPQPENKEESEEMGLPDDEETTSNGDLPEGIRSINIDPGDFVLHKVYLSHEMSDLSKKLTAKRPPRYKARESIKREASLGVDKEAS